MNVAIEKVYTALLTKVLHCCFAPIIRRRVEINIRSNDKQALRAGLKAATSTTAKKKAKDKGPTGSVKKVKKTPVAKVTPQGGEDAMDFDSIIWADDELMQVTELT